MSGRERTERKRNAERARLEAVRALGAEKSSEATDALIELLDVSEHHPRFQEQVLAQLRRSPVDDLSTRVAERSPILGVSLLTERREPAVLPILEQMITEGEALAAQGKATKHWCIAVCAAASYGHEPSRARLDWLFSNAEGLDQKSFLAPMLRALCSGDPADAWELSASIRTLVTEEPRYAGPLMRAAFAVPSPDPRWVEVAMGLLERGSGHAIDPLVHFAANDSELRDRLAALPGPRPLEVLARVGDSRAVEKLQESLRASRSFHAMRGTIAQLRLLPEVDESLHERALVELLETLGRIHEEETWELFGTDDPAERPVFATFTSDENVDRLLAAFDAARFESEASSRKAAKAKKEVRARIERLRPKE